MIDNKPLVAIKCATYNHEPYIRDCLEGFVMQKTGFPFVAIVHDDASTDGTAAIVKEYAEKYPDIIKPIFETENQYSKHDGSLNRIMDDACAATGAKYLTLCEGDDYWIDPLKLQRQVDFMEANSDYTMCFHNIKVRCNDTYSSFTNHYNKTKDAPIKDVIQRGGDFVPTLSMLIRSSVYFNAPKEVFSQYVGDYPLQIYLAMAGKVRYFHEIMGVYRVSPSSATITLLNNPSKIKSNIKGELKIYEDLDSISNFKYSKYFNRRQNFFLSTQMYRLNRYGDARKYWWRARLCNSKHNKIMIMDIHGRITVFRFIHNFIYRLNKLLHIQSPNYNTPI